MSVFVGRGERRVESNSTREMINYLQTRREERVDGVKAGEDFIEVFIDIFNGASEFGLLFVCEVECCKPMGGLVLGMCCI